jgi:hypothetical protein
MPIEVIFEVNIPPKADFNEVRDEIVENGGLQDARVIVAQNPVWPAGVAFDCDSVVGEEVNRNGRERDKLHVIVTWLVAAPVGTTLGDLSQLLKNAYTRRGFFGLPFLSPYRAKLLSIKGRR